MFRNLSLLYVPLDGDFMAPKNRKLSIEDEIEGVLVVGVFLKTDFIGWMYGLNGLRVGFRVVEIFSEL